MWIAPSLRESAEKAVEARLEEPQMKGVFGSSCQPFSIEGRSFLLDMFLL